MLTDNKTYLNKTNVKLVVDNKNMAIKIVIYIS